MAQAFRHTVKLDQVEQGLAFLNIQLEGPLDAAAAKQVAVQVAERVAALGGRPFGLLFDVRNVTTCDEGGASAMQGIEMAAADKGLEKVAHLVKQPTLAGAANAAVAELGGQKLIGTFDDETSARRFASGLS